MQVFVVLERRYIPYEVNEEEIIAVFFNEQKAIDLVKIKESLPEVNDYYDYSYSYEMHEVIE